MQKECQYCKSIFTTYPSHDRRCCSVQCANKIRKGKPNPKLKSGKNIPCDLCGKEFYIPKCKFKKKRFCSRECQYSHLKKTNEWGLPRCQNGSVKNNPYERISIQGKWYKKHRLIMEERLGRRLGKNEHVHHKNGNPRDNIIENLEIVDAKEHAKIHYKINSSW